MYCIVNVGLLRPTLYGDSNATDSSSLIVDGNLTSASCTNTSLTPNSWWTVDLGRPMDVGRVCVTSSETPTEGQLRSFGCTVPQQCLRRDSVTLISTLLLTYLLTY